MDPEIEQIPESTINGLNKVFQRKTFRYSGPIMAYSNDEESNVIEFDYNLNIVGQKKMISTGDWRNFIVVDVTIKNPEGPYSPIFDLIYNTNSFKLVLTNRLYNVFNKLGFSRDFSVNLNNINLE
jgi:hypothetical protein